MSKTTSNNLQKEHRPSSPEAPTRNRPVRPAGPHAELLSLQRAAGNRAVSPLITGDMNSTLETRNEAPPSVYKLQERGGGQSLDAVTHQWMESRFGEDFDQVRIHTGAEAAESAKEAKARAYTVGKDIVFGEGNYRPETASGRHLIAHELAHVIQQRGNHNHVGKPSTSLAISERSDPVEHEAERAAVQVMQGGSERFGSEIGRPAPSISPARGNSLTVYRFPDVEPDMIEGDKKRTHKDPNTGLERKVYDPTKGGYAKNPSATELSSVVKNGKVGGGFENGKFMYVVDEKGNVIVGKRLGESMPHPTLIGGQNPKIQAAGTVEIQGGKIVSFDNHSGHYKPPKSSLKNAVKSFMKLDENVFRNLKVMSFHVEQGKETFKRFHSFRLLKLKKFDIQRVLKKFRWTSIKGRMRSRNFRATAKGAAAVLAIILVDWLLSKYLGDVHQKFEEKIIKRDLEQEEPKVRATLEKALEAKMDELDALLENNPDAKVYVNVRYRFGRLSTMNWGPPEAGGGHLEETSAVELKFVDAGFSNTPWTDEKGTKIETMNCGTSQIEYQPVTLSEEIPVKELFEYEEETEEETKKEFEAEPLGGK